ncbi:MAG: thioredoxin domain-containing protein [Nannocystales bacterium]
MEQTPTLQLTFEVSAPDRPSYRVALRKPKNLVGRESGDVVLGDTEASALHAEIDTTAGHVIVRDLGSSNGTWRDGKRLPQFALYEGQSFYCGNTQLRLISIEGAHDELKPGQTAVGRTKVQTHKTGHDTLLGTPHPNASSVEPPPGWSPPSPVSLGEPAPVAETTHVAPRVKPASTTLSGPHAPSSSPTAPGDSSSPPTLSGGQTQVGAPPPPEGPPAVRHAPPSSSTVPGPAGTTSATPSSRTLPVGTTDVTATIPEAASDVETRAPAPAPAPEPPPTPEPATAEPTPEPPAALDKKPVYRAPVANAVIKPGGASNNKDRDPAPRSERPPRRWGRLLSIAGFSALGVTALAGLGYLLYTLVAGRGLGFSDDVAEGLPSTTIGFIALQSVQETVALVANEDLDAQWEELRVDALGFDPYDDEQWSKQGINTEAAVGFAVLDAKAPTFAVSFGVTDRAALKSAVAKRAALLLATTEDEASWSERTFGEADGLWHEERGIAVIHHEARATVLFAPRPGWNDEVEDHASEIGSLLHKDSLAETEAYGALVAPPGDIVGLGYVDGSALRNALPAGAAALAARLALADLDGIAMVLSHETDAIHLTHEVVVREGSRHLDVLGDAKRDGKALARLQGPVLAAYDVQLNGDSLDRAVGGVISALGESVSAVEKDVSDELGIDLRTDVTQNLSGAFGGALLGIPSERGQGHELKAVSWVGVKDGEKAKKTLERLYDRAVTKVKDREVTPRDVAGVQVYTVAGNPDYGRPDLQSFVHEDMLWVLVGPVDAAMVIETPKSAFLDEPRHPSIAAALSKGANLGAFADLAGLAAAAKPLLRPRDQEEFETLAPLIDAFETATVRSDRKGRTIVVRSTAHTADGLGLRGVLETATKLAGEAMGEEFARATRASRCAALSKHVLQLSRNSLEESGAPLEAAWEIERSVQEQCDKPSMTTARLECYLESESIQGLAACDAKHPARESATGTDPVEPHGDPTELAQPEPKVVPYVDDIWPHRVDDPDSDSPQPDVNYAVSVGNDAHTRGPSDALVTIVMFGDFECEHCRSVTGTLDELLAEHGKDVRLVFRNLPLENIHPSARAAAQASLAAGEQDKFWEMHDALFERGNRLSADTIEAAAKQAGLEMTRYKTDLGSADIDRRLQRDVDAAAKFGVRGTPAFFINGRYLGGRQSASAFETVISEELARAKKFAERRGNTRKRIYEDMQSHFAPEVVLPQRAIEAPAGDSKRYVVSTEGLPSKGATTFAQIEIIECGDFDCPFCARSRKALDETLESYPAVAFFFAHNPLDYHPGAEPAARAAQAAHAQGKFWEMHDELYKDQRSKARSDEDYKRYAARLGLDVKQFEEDYAATKTAEAVAAQQKLCTDHDATATPTFFINGRRVTGAQTAEQLSALVESELSTGI